MNMLQLTSWSRIGPVLLGMAGLGAGGAALVVHQTTERPAPAAMAAAPAPTAAPSSLAAFPAIPSPPAPAPVVVIEPSFDVVRVGSTGQAVLAGRAEPGATVTVRDGDAVLGEAKADNRGEWVLAPTEPLAPGGRELTLSARGPSGAAPGAASVLLSVPVRGAAPTPAVLVLPPAGEPQLLGAQLSPGTRLGLGTVDYDDRGSLRFAGTAPPNAPVRVYVDNVLAAEGAADPRGRWMLAPTINVPGGLHRVRVDQIGMAGRVQARVEVPFERSTLPAAELAGGRMVVQPGETLWRMARGAYGNGARYKVIYLANKDQIRDPRLIYPGQALAVPQ